MKRTTCPACSGPLYEDRCTRCGGLVPQRVISRQRLAERYGVQVSQACTCPDSSEMRYLDVILPEYRVHGWYHECGRMVQWG